MAKSVRQETATIPISGTDSDTVTVPNNATLLGFVTPAALDGANLSFKVGYDANITPVVMRSGGSAYSLAVAPSGYYPVDANLFQGAKYLQVVSDVGEAAARDIVLIFGQLQ